MEKVSSTQSGYDAEQVKTATEQRTKRTSRKKNKDKNNSTSKKGITVHRKFSAMGYMMRLANAKNAAQVSSVIISVEAAARTIRSTGASEKEVEAAKRIADKVQTKGRLKIGRLRKEKLLQMRKKQEAKKGHMRKAMELTRTLAKKKRARKAQERMDVVNAAQEDRLRKEQDKYVPPMEIDYTIEADTEIMVADNVSMADVGMVVGESIDISL